MIKRLLIITLLFFLIITVTENESCFAATERITFTAEEFEFILNHPVIRLGVDPEFVPFEFIDSDGVYKGIAADYVALVEEKSGLKFEVEKGLTWPEAYDKAVQGDLDILPCVSKTDARAKLFLFSDPYYYFQRAVYVKNNNQSVKALEDLKNQIVAVQINSSHQSFLLDYPDIHLSLYYNVFEALEAVSKGKVFAFVGNEATSNYLMKENGISNLKYSILETDTKDSLYFAVRRDWPELVSILNKCIGSITTEERIGISNKWIGIDDTLVYRRILQIGVIIGLILLSAFILSSFWITRLKKEISLRKKAEADLKRLKEEAELSNTYKSSFLARMSHEIRTPMNAITGMTYLLEKSDLNSSQRLYLDKISHATKNMLGIINDILDFSKIEAGKITLEKVSFNLDLLLEQVINIISYQIEEQGIDFQVNKSPEVPAYFYGDPLRIQQILMNIINNAIKFTSEGSVSVSIDLLSKTDENCLISFQVKDTGIGMTKDQLSQIFIPFDQGDASISRRFGGTGLGLTIAKTLAEQMDGEIQVESIENEGSVFTVKLRLEIDTAVMEQTNNQVIPPERKQSDNEVLYGQLSEESYHVLIVEDNKTNQLIAQSILTPIGCRITMANDGKEGYEFFAAHQDDVDLILMDLHMPVLNGLDATALIRKIDNSVPIIAMTADAITGIEAKCKAAGINYYISKPFDPDQFLQTVADVLKSTDHKPTIDYEDGLCRIGSSAEVYHSILKYFCEEISEVADKITEAIETEDFGAASDLVHKVKGSSGNIGAKKLYKASIELQTALKAGDGPSIRKSLPLFINHINIALIDIKKYLD